MRSSVLIAIPINDEKRYCLPVFLKGLKRLIKKTDHDVTVAFAINSEDVRVLEQIWLCKVRHHLLPTPRRRIAVPHDHVFSNHGAELDYMANLCLARNILREYARIIKVDWLFFLDADCCVEPETLNRLIAHTMPVAGCMFAQRQFYANADPAPPRSTVWTGDATLFWDDVKDIPHVIRDSSTSFGGCLIRQDVFDENMITFQTQNGAVHRSEDTYFAIALREKGISVCADHHIKTIHFMQPNAFPNGWTNRDDVMTYNTFATWTKQP
ncbi:MAG: glycosyltransferase family 2 protein [Planctomycetes bacterium]|nr:glycosyltransferase family 2 protein [Planctomycetota bacterium]